MNQTSSTVGREVSGGVWPLLCAGPGPRHFCAGVGPCAGRPLLRGAATLNGSSVPHGHETVSETGHFCAGPGSPCFYFALGLHFVTLIHLTGSPTPGPFLASRPLSTLGALLVHAAYLGREARALSPSLRGASCLASGPCRPQTGPKFAAPSLQRGACRKRC